MAIEMLRYSWQPSSRPLLYQLGHVIVQFLAAYYAPPLGGGIKLSDV